MCFFSSRIGNSLQSWEYGCVRLGHGGGLFFLALQWYGEVPWCGAEKAGQAGTGAGPHTCARGTPRRNWSGACFPPPCLKRKFEDSLERLTPLQAMKDIRKLQLDLGLISLACTLSNPITAKLTKFKWRLSFCLVFTSSSMVFLFQRRHLSKRARWPSISNLFPGRRSIVACVGLLKQD